MSVTGLSIANKVYDSTKTAALVTSGATFVGLISGDDVALAPSSATATFASARAGTGITVIVTGLSLGGSQSTDYTLALPPPLTGTITPAPLTVSGITASNRVYNASTSATVQTAVVTLLGVFSGDRVNLNRAGASGTFASANVGTGITVTVTGLSLNGLQSVDYTLMPATTTANITPATPQVSISTAGATYSGSPVGATVILTGASGPSGSTLEGVAPTLEYYDGIVPGGTPSSNAPTAAGSYTVVANFPGSVDYTPQSSLPTTFTIRPAAPTLTVSVSGVPITARPSAPPKPSRGSAVPRPGNSRGPHPRSCTTPAARHPALHWTVRPSTRVLSP